MTYENSPIDEIKKYLKDNGSTLLSKIGDIVPKENRPPNQSLKFFLENNDIYVTRKGSGPEIYAHLDKECDITENKQICADQYTQRIRSRTDIKKSIFDAFTVQLEDNQKIGINIKNMKFQIIKNEEDFKDDFIEVPQSLRISGQVSSEEEFSKLERFISQWAELNGVKMDNILWKPKKKIPMQTNINSALLTEKDIRELCKIQGEIITKYKALSDFLLQKLYI